VNVLAALGGKEVADLLHESGGSLVGGGVAWHLDGLGHEVADCLDFLGQELLSLRVVEPLVVDPIHHFLAHVAQLARGAKLGRAGGGAQAELGAVDGSVQQLLRDVSQDGGGFLHHGGVAESLMGGLGARARDARVL
jgi:hypothetical protein